MINRIIAKMQCADCSATAESTISVVGRECRGSVTFELEAECPERWSTRKEYIDSRGFEFRYAHVCEMCSAGQE